MNYNSIKVIPQNFEILKKISQDLQIDCLSELIDNLINDYMFTIQINNNKRSNINSITQLFECLYNRKKLKTEIVNELIINSKWSQAKENVEELAACIIQVIHSDILLHPFLLDLIIMLDKSNSDNNQLNVLLPFITKNLLSNIGHNLLNCSFKKKKKILNKDIYDEIVKYIHCNMYLDNFLVGYAAFNNKKYLCCERINNSLIWFFKEEF